MSRKSVRKFLRKVANRQKDNDDYVSSLVELVSWSLTSLFSTNMAISETILLGGSKYSVFSV